MKFTAIIEKSENGWFIGQIEEVPAALSQGRTIEELRSNLKDALLLVFETNKALINAEYADKVVLREVIALHE